MTAKVASPACRGLGMQRSVKSQALASHPGPIVLHSKYQTPPPPPTRALLSAFDAAAFCSLSSRSCRSVWVYLLIQPCCQTPVGRKVSTLGLVRLHQSRRRRTACPIIWEGPAAPLTPSSILLLQGGCSSDASMLPCGFNPPRLLKTLCPSLCCVLRPRRSHFYLLSPLTAEGMTASCRKRFVSS